MIVYAAPFLGLPELIAGSRLCSTEQLFILAVVVIPVDLAAGQSPLRPADVCCRLRLPREWR